MKRLIVILLALIVLAIPISTTKTAIADDSHKTNDLHEAYIAYLGAQEWSAQLTSYSKTLVGKRTGQCVTSLRAYFGESRKDVQGLAKNTKPNTQTPEIGSIIILKMSWAGHVGKIIDIDGNTITYWDSNGDWSQRGAIRTININDRRIAGYRITK